MELIVKVHFAELFIVSVFDDDPFALLRFEVAKVAWYGIKYGLFKVFYLYLLKLPFIGLIILEDIILCSY